MQDDEHLVSSPWTNRTSTYLLIRKTGLCVFLVFVLQPGTVCVCDQSKTTFTKYNTVSLPRYSLCLFSLFPVNNPLLLCCTIVFGVGACVFVLAV